MTDRRYAATGSNGEVLTAVDIERRIMATFDRMEEQVHDLAQKAREAAEAEAAYKSRFAQERLQARSAGGSGPGGRTTNDEADDKALRACSDELTQHLITEALYQAARDALHVRRSQMDALRTIASNLRAQT